MLRCHSQLKVRAALMPEVVSAVEALEAQAGASRKPEYVGAGGRPRQRSWAVSPKLFPCELSSEAKSAISEVCRRLARLLGSAIGLQNLASCRRTQAPCLEAQNWCATTRSHSSKRETLPTWRSLTMTQVRLTWRGGV